MLKVHTLADAVAQTKNAMDQYGWSFPATVEGMINAIVSNHAYCAEDSDRPNDELTTSRESYEEAALELLEDGYGTDGITEPRS